MTTLARALDGYTYKVNDDLYVQRCCNCQILFAVPSAFDKTAREDPNIWFYCPLGHRQHYTDTELQKLRREKERLAASLTSTRDQLQAARKETNHQEARVRGYQGALAKTKKRQAKGVCPVPGCKRHFVDVQRHIASQHPDYAHGAEE